MNLKKQKIKKSPKHVNSSARFKTTKKSGKKIFKSFGQNYSAVEMEKVNSFVRNAQRTGVGKSGHYKSKILPKLKIAEARASGLLKILGHATPPRFTLAAFVFMLLGSALALAGNVYDRRVAVWAGNSSKFYRLESSQQINNFENKKPFSLSKVNRGGEVLGTETSFQNMPMPELHDQVLTRLPGEDLKIQTKYILGGSQPQAQSQDSTGSGIYSAIQSSYGLSNELVSGQATSIYIQPNAGDDFNSQIKNPPEVADVIKPALYHYSVW